MILTFCSRFLLGRYLTMVGKHNAGILFIVFIFDFLRLQSNFSFAPAGTCKHYRKSFRWLRFPCCGKCSFDRFDPQSIELLMVCENPFVILLFSSGKCYPCDTCHDAAEDHPAVWANRMLCGFCGLEQPFSSKPCSCGSQLAKSSSMTRFWEGGKGNRNTRALSKNDSKKSVTIAVKFPLLLFLSQNFANMFSQVCGSQQNNIEARWSLARAQVQVNSHGKNKNTLINLTKDLPHDIYRMRT